MSQLLRRAAGGRAIGTGEADRLTGRWETSQALDRPAPQREALNALHGFADEVRDQTGARIRAAAAEDLLTYAQAVYRRIGGPGLRVPPSAGGARVPRSRSATWTAVGMVGAGFGMGRGKTVYGAWLVLRANQKWAPYPDNDPDAARDLMRRFYLLVARDSGDLRIDPKRASELEVEWWRLHRAHQHDPGVPGSELEQSLVDLYAYVYDADPAAVRPAAAARVEAMDLSDAWVEAGARRRRPAAGA